MIQLDIVGQAQRCRVVVALVAVSWWCCTTTSAMAESPSMLARSWFWGDDVQRALQDELIGTIAPRLQVSDWYPNAPTRRQLAGKIIVVHFWATWSTPSLKSIAHSNRLLRRYQRHGVEVIGICGSQHGQEHMSMLADRYRAKFLVARDPLGTSAKAWRVMWWPTYAVVGRGGRIVALGAKAASVRRLVDQILHNESSEQNAGGGEKLTIVSARWTEGGAARRDQLDNILNRQAPALKLQRWVNRDAQKLASLKGKVVLLTFLQTTKSPSLHTLRPLEEVYRKYRNRGLVVIGICHQRDAAQIEKLLSTHEITFPVAVDVGGACFGDYQVNGAPDFFLVDRAGRLRIADCKHDLVDNGIEWLLGE